MVWDANLMRRLRVICRKRYFCRANIMYRCMFFAFKPRNVEKRFKNIFFTLFLGLSLLFVSCQENKKCPYKPEPIFKQGLPHILQYNFERQGSQSLESMLLDTQVLLEIHQDVCEQSRQEYRFTVKGNFTQFPDSMWMKEATRQLAFLSSFSPEQASLRPWADIIENYRHDMRLGEDREVQRGIFINVDRITGSDQSTLLVVFTQR